MIVTVTEAPTGAVSLFGAGGGGGGGGGGAAATSGPGLGGGGPCTAGPASGPGAVAGAAGLVLEPEPDGAAVAGALDGAGAAWVVVPSEFTPWAGAAGGVELLHPLRIRAAESDKAAAKDNDFMRIDSLRYNAIAHTEKYTRIDRLSVLKVARAPKNAPSRHFGKRGTSLIRFRLSAPRVRLTQPENQHECSF